MTMAYAVTQRDVQGSLAVSVGTFTNAGGETGGIIDTGLHRVYAMFLQHTGSSVATNAPVVNETITAAGTDGSSITIVTDDGADGLWMAYGDQHT